VFGTGLLVFFESSDDSSAVINREESCLVGEIVDHPVRNNANDYSDQAFENENPSLYPEFVSIRLQGVAFSVFLTQPGLPPTPFICAIPAAKSPPNDPASAAAEKKMAARMPSSLRLYLEQSQSEYPPEWMVYSLTYQHDK